MYRYLRLLLVLILFFVCEIVGYTQQFESSVFMNHRLIEDKDLSMLDTIKFIGWTVEEYYDRRIPDYIKGDIAVYQVHWKDNKEMQVHVLKEFFDNSTQEEVLEEFIFPFAYKTGQLPRFLLEGINRIVLLKGIERCSASSGSIYIHVEDHNDKISDFVEEMLLHEGGHASVDKKYQDLPGWKSAQLRDSMSISKYAAENITTEDFTESIIAWLALKYRPKRISSGDSAKIAETMPARLAFLDSLNFDAYPLDTPNEFDYLYEFVESSDDLEGSMSFDEFMLNVFYVFIAVLFFYIIRFMTRDVRF